MEIVLILSANDIARNISMKDAIVAVRNGYAETARKSAVVPKRSIIISPEHNGITSFLPSSIPTKQVLGVKIASVFRDNPSRGIPLVNSIIVLQEGKTGEFIAFMDGRLTTAIKTGAATGVATDALSKIDSKSIGLIGTGYQARFQIEAICEVRPKIAEIDVFDIDRNKCKAFVKESREILSHYPIKINLKETSEETVKDKDIIITVTNSFTPVFDGRIIKKGVHINAVGSFTADMQELDEITISRSDKIVTDVREDALEMAGDLVAVIKKGTDPSSLIYSELGEIVIGEKLGRERDDEITIFESIGLSTLDISIAEKIYRNCMEQKIGKKINLDI